MSETINDAEPVMITDLKIISSIQEFTWNFNEVKQTIEGSIQKYVGLVVTDENLKDMETAQKEIASIRTKVDGFRKAVKKKMEEPYKVFEAEIKELLQLSEKAEAPLKQQTLKYEQDRIIAKEAELNKFAQATALNMGVRPEYFKFVIPSQWTNRTAKDSVVRKEIVTAIEAMLDTQRRDDEAKKMEEQRIGLIEGQCKAHSVLLKTPVVPADVNHLLVGVELVDIPAIIMTECLKRAEVEKKAAEPVVEIIPPRPDHVHHPDDNSIGFPNYGTDDNYPQQSLEQECNGQNLHVPASFIAPPLPPALRPLPPMPPLQQSQLFDCFIKFPGITAQEGVAIKEFLTSRAISFKIISQEPVRSDF